MRITIPYRPRYPEVHRQIAGARFSVLVAHRRFGKTVLAVCHLIRCAVSCSLRLGHYGYVAPFRNQAKSVAWDYLKHYTRVIPGLEINESELSVSLPAPGGRSKIRIFGADRPDALRGLYFDGIVLDEVAQMKPEVWDEIVQPALADRQGWALFIGTPKGVNLFSRMYYHALREQAAGNPGWLALTFPVHATNVLPKPDVERMQRDMSDAKFRQEMLCDFSASSDETLISIDEARAAMERTPDMKLAENWPLVLGVDIARYGEDATVFCRRQGLVCLEPLILRGKSNTEVADRLIAYISEFSPQYVNIDQGQGTGVIDIVRGLAPRDVIITEVPFGSRAHNPQLYFNRRAEMWTSLRDWLRGGGRLPKDELLLQELTAPCYSFDSQGRIRLEAKDEIRKRLGHSTDAGDAIALTFAVPIGPRNFRRKSQRKRKPYDPFA